VDPERWSEEDGHRGHWECLGSYVDGEHRAFHGGQDICE